MTSNEDQDRADMERLKAGENTALEDLMARHGETLLHYLIRALQNEEDAADLAQETFVRVYEKRAMFDTGRKFTTWLYAIASNLVKDRYRYRSRHPQVSLEAESPQSGGSLADQLTAEIAPPGEKLQRNERAEAVRRAVAALPEELRLPLILAEYEGLAQGRLVWRCTARSKRSRRGFIGLASNCDGRSRASLRRDSFVAATRGELPTRKGQGAHSGAAYQGTERRFTASKTKETN